MTKLWLTLLGCLWFLIGLLNVFCVIRLGWPLHVLGGIWIYGLIIFGLSLGAFTIVSAVAFMRRSSWARVALEAVCWFAVFSIPLVSLVQYGLREVVLRSQVLDTHELVSSIRPWSWGALVGLLFYVVSLAGFRSRVVRASFIRG
jgi:hypothetical protein